MTGGGPDRSTETLLTYLYESAFKNSEFGYATAIAVVNFVVVMLLAAGILFWLRKDPEGARK
jgi:N-acetylglucosamine transport system permease protein